MHFGFKSDIYLEGFYFRDSQPSLAWIISHVSLLSSCASTLIKTAQAKTSQHRSQSIKHSSMKAYRHLDWLCVISIFTMRLSLCPTTLLWLLVTLGWRCSWWTLATLIPRSTTAVSGLPRRTVVGVRRKLLSARSRPWSRDILVAGHVSRLSLSVRRLIVTATAAARTPDHRIGFLGLCRRYAWTIVAWAAAAVRRAVMSCRWRRRLVNGVVETSGHRLQINKLQRWAVWVSVLVKACDIYCYVFCCAILSSVGDQPRWAFCCPGSPFVFVCVVLLFELYIVPQLANKSLLPLGEIRTKKPVACTCDWGSLAKVNKLSWCCVPAPVLQVRQNTNQSMGLTFSPLIRRF